MKVETRHEIQSVCIGNANILAGTRSGDIYELRRPKGSELKEQHGVTNKENKIARLNCHDHETPKAIGFSNTNDRIFAITQMGLFSVWEISTLKMIHSYSFHKQTVGMIVFRNKMLLLLAFENEILMLNTDRKSNYSVYPTFSKKYERTIVDVKSSFNGNYIAVAISPEGENNARIDM